MCISVISKRKIKVDGKEKILVRDRNIAAYIVKELLNIIEICQ
jgi:chromosomal replication initiation ATPase DnaA